MREELGDVLLQVVFMRRSPGGGAFQFQRVPEGGKLVTAIPTCLPSPRQTRRMPCWPSGTRSNARKKARRPPRTFMERARGCRPCSRHGSSRKKPPSRI
ncbi:MAG: hypothetical protein ACLT8E_00275 [Akkermansia sp.]